MAEKTLKVPTSLTRAATLTQEVGEDGLVTMSISSDVPYLRYDWWNDEEYWEVLDHGPGGIDDERLKAGLPILFNHDRNKHLGRGMSFENDGHKCTVTAKFGESPLAKEKLADVRAGILVDTSVGYELIGDGICIGAKDEKPIYKFRFKVYEGSLVTIPADASVGAGRQRDHKPAGEPKEISIRSKEEFDKPNKESHKQETQPDMKLTKAARIHFEADKDKGGAPEIDPVKERANAIADFKARCKKITDYVKALKNEAWRKKAEVVAAKHIEGEADFDAFRTEALDQFTTETNLDTPEPGDQRQQGSGIQVIGERKRLLSVGEQVIRNKNFVEVARMTGHQRAASVKADVSVMGLRGKVALAQRAGFTSSDLAAINVAPQQGLIGLGMERLTIMDLIPGGTTSAIAIPFPKENTLGTLDGVAVNSQRPQAGMVGEGGLKPTWEPDVTTDTANVKKIAVVTKVPDEFIADFPAFGSYIDNRLPAMVDFKAEEQILYGDNTGNNLKGILTNSGIQTRAYATSWADTLKRAITDVEVGSFFAVDGIAMHPYDWEVASLEKDSDGRYIAGGPYYIGLTNGVYVEIRTIWGKRVVTTTAVTVGQPVVASWGMGAQYFMREGMRLETTNANEDDFKKNLIAVRAEERLALATYRPSCFLQITGGPARS